MRALLLCLSMMSFGSLAAAQTPGDDVLVGRSHVVEAVVTDGGDALIEGRVDDDVHTAGGDALIRGVVEGDVVTDGGDVRIEGRVEGDVISRGGVVSLGPDGRVEGEIVQPGPVPQEWGASIASAVGEGAPMDSLHRGRGLHQAPSEDTGSALGTLFGRIGAFALVFLLSLGLRTMAPTRFAEAQAAVVTAPTRGGAVGFVALSAGAVLALGLMVTIVGIPVAFVLGTVLGLAGAVGLALTASVLGAALPVERWKPEDAKRLAAGVAALFVLTWVPWVGPVAAACAACVGVGAFVRTRPKPATSVAQGPYRTA